MAISLWFVAVACEVLVMRCVLLSGVRKHFIVVVVPVACCLTAVQRQVLLLLRPGCEEYHQQVGLFAGQLQVGASQVQL